MIKGKPQNEKITYSGKLGKIMVPMKASFIIVMFLILFLLLAYMQIYPQYQSSIMGNDTFPPQIKIFIASTPVIIIIIVIAFWIILSTIGFFRSENKPK
jgi:hypothetical protein